MKVFTAYIALLLIVVTSSVGGLRLLVTSDLLKSPPLLAMATVSGLRRVPVMQVKAFESNVRTDEIGLAADQDNFAVVEEQVETSFIYEEWEEFEFTYGKQSTTAADQDLIYKNYFAELPLKPQDYYYRKYENAAAGVKGINRSPVLRPGDSVGIIADKYINIKTYNGYVQPPGYYFASGVCWTSSALGFMMDNANAQFRKRYGIDLFTFRAGDRAPHPDYYETYHGRGDTIMQITEGVPLQDFRFTVNPKIKNLKQLQGVKFKIMMVATDEHETAAYGQSIGAYILSNKQL